MSMGVMVAMATLVKPLGGQLYGHQSCCVSVGKLSCASGDQIIACFLDQRQGDLCQLTADGLQALRATSLHRVRLLAAIHFSSDATDVPCYT